MKVLRYFILALFICSVFSCVSVSTKYPQFVGDNDLFSKENSWLMLKSEKKAFEEAKTDKEKEQIIEQFWKARDPNVFTVKNEFELYYQKNLKVVRKDYLDSDDPRRYVFLLFGEPKLRRTFADQVVTVTTNFPVRIRIDKAEIWYYNFGKQSFQVIFTKIDPLQLQWFRDQRKSDVFSPVLFSSSKHEILYIGGKYYPDIETFLENFFQEGFRLKTTKDTVDDLKKPVLDRARNFYKKTEPKARKGKYYHIWEKGLQPLVNQFDINLPEEVGISVWLMFDKDSLNYAGKNKYIADLAVYCEAVDSRGEQIIYYRDDCVKYELKEQKRYYYHFWGSLPAGDYKLILEVGDNISKKKYKKEIKISDYSTPGLKANIWVGKAINEPERVKGMYSYFSLLPKEGIFCPADSLERFRDTDEIIVIFYVSGFRKNHYGICYIETGLSFVKGKIENHEFVDTGEVYQYRFPSVEKRESRFQSIAKIKLANNFQLPLGMRPHRVELSIWDAIANISYSLRYNCSILILTTTRETTTNNSIRRRN